MSHPYLNLSESETYPGKFVVGTTSFHSTGNGLTNKSVKIVQIPQTFNGTEIAEIGYLSFYYLVITSVFIPKTVLRICTGAFENCAQLNDVRFEEESKLQQLNLYVFYMCSSLKKIDFPASVTTILTSGYYFFDRVSLDCFSYSGTTDFSSLSDFFYSVSNVYVTTSYPSSTFAGKAVIKGTHTCGVSKEHLEEPNTGINPPSKHKCSAVLVRNHVLCSQYMFLLLHS